MSVGRWAATVVVLVLAVAIAVGCGGGSSTDSSTKTSGEPSRQFQDPKGPNGPEPVATFGAESGDGERSDASNVLAENLTARQDADFTAQCATLGKRGMEAVLGEGSSKANLAKCKTELEKVAKPLPSTKKIRTDTLDGEIAALRIKGDQAFALYHGTDGKDWAMPMEVDGGEWKVGAILTTELPQAKPKAESKSEKKKNG